MSNENERNNAITDDEAALYDRQIRLWGLDAQKRLRASHILISGLRGLAAEVAKNIMLSGVSSLTLQDDKNVEQEDIAANFFISEKDIGKNRAVSSKAKCQLLNPNVKVETDEEKLADKPEEYFKKFNVVIITSEDSTLLIKINNICRKHQVKFFCGDTWGFFGYFFEDLLNHKYLEEAQSKIKKEDATVDLEDGPPTKKLKADDYEEQATMQKTQYYVPLETSLAVKSGKVGIGLDKKTSPLFLLTHVLLRFYKKHSRYPFLKERADDLKELLQIKVESLKDLGMAPTRLSDNYFDSVFGQMSPVAAVVGGVLAQEVIKGLSGKNAPLHNFFLFNGETGSGVVESVGA